jgi:hypothetical protein
VLLFAKQSNLCMRCPMVRTLPLGLWLCPAHIDRK